MNIRTFLSALLILIIGSSYSVIANAKNCYRISVQNGTRASLHIYPSNPGNRTDLIASVKPNKTYSLCVKPNKDLYFKIKAEASTGGWATMYKKLRINKSGKIMCEDYFRQNVVAFAMGIKEIAYRRPKCFYK